MPDRLTLEQRRKAMQAVKCRDTSIELKVMRALRRLGLRPKRNVLTMRGKPDFVFAKARLIVFVDGDFWHGWHFSKWRHKLQPFWHDKIERNRRRDAKTHRALRHQGWRVIRIWEHQILEDLEGVVRLITSKL